MTNLFELYKSNKDMIDFILLFFKIFIAIIILCLGFLLNKTYYENISLEFYSKTEEDTTYKNTLTEELVADEQSNKIVFVTASDVPLEIEVMEFESISSDGDLSFKSTGKIKSVEPGDTLKISYLEGEGIPKYQLKASTPYGSADIPLNYNGRFGDINKTKIKSTRKVIPYFFHKILD